MRKWAVIPDPNGPVALDATYSIGDELSGVGVYSRHILYGLAAAHPRQRFTFAYRSHRLLASLKERLPSNTSRAWLHGSGIAPRRCAIFHSLNQRLDTRYTRAVATFHDLFVISGDYSTAEFRRRFTAQAQAAAERADLIIAVSRFTAEQLTGLLKVDPGRIRVVHHGVDPPPSPPLPERQRENIILHIGAIQKRKNLERLVEAFERTPPTWRLVLAGSRGFGAGPILERIARSPRCSDIQVAGYIDSGRLEELYSSARIFAFPSLDEGFGMPVLEAMARGVPVITSNGSALPEVAGDAAITVDPLDSQQIEHALVEMCGSEEKREAYRLRGFERASNFSWQTAVDKTWRVYTELG